MPTWWDWEKSSERMTTSTLSLSIWKKTSISSWKKGKNTPDTHLLTGLTPAVYTMLFLWCHSAVCVCVFIFFITIGNVRIIWVRLSHHVSVFIFAETSCSLSQSSETWHFRYYRDCPLSMNMVGEHRPKKKTDCAVFSIFWNAVLSSRQRCLRINSS